ncbi:MAG: hypothetical protein E2O77_08575 [Caldithrix sp.]|nr:MAG: hypothetical protein E2O77_08575 [Caldithrix sp.]
MKELLYFSSTDLMVQVSYKKEANSLNYSSHRKLSFGERVIVEQYLLTNIAVKTDYYKKHPALFNYLGINSKLNKDLNEFHLKNTIKKLKEKDTEAADLVKRLINKSMASYYFERIGNTILEIREAVKEPLYNKNMEIYESKLKQLVDAYNVHSVDKVTYQNIVPTELKYHL